MGHAVIRLRVIRTPINIPHLLLLLLKDSSAPSGLNQISVASPHWYAEAEVARDGQLSASCKQLLVDNIYTCLLVSLQMACKCLFFFSFAASVFLTQHEVQRFYSCTTATDRLGKIAHAPQRHFMLNLYKNPPDYQCNGSSSHLALLWMMGNHRHRFSEQILATIYLLPWILLDALWSLATAVMATSMHTWGVKM